MGLNESIASMKEQLILIESMDFNFLSFAY